MRSLSSLVLFTILFLSTRADAHVSIISGPAAANKSQKITFGVGHGCTGADTLKIRVEIPAGVTSVRALYSDFGKPSIEGTAAAVTAVTWTKDLADLQAEDFGYYELTIRARVADVPFSTILFNVYQTCRTAGGVETTVPWTELPGTVGGTGDTAPGLIVVPARIPGWNKFTLAAAVPFANVPTYLGDAQIVWKGNAAYSSSAALAPMIANTPGVTALSTDLAAGDELWVKY